MADKSILFVEDNEVLQSILARVLEQRGYRVTVAASAYESRDLFRAGLAVDLVIVDLSIPGRNDPDVIREVREMARGIPVLYISGYSKAEAHRRFDFPAEAAFLAKPFMNKQLLATVEALLQGTPATALNHSLPR